MAQSCCIIPFNKVICAENVDIYQNMEKCSHDFIQNYQIIDIVDVVDIKDVKICGCRGVSVQIF